ncbi:hypothetical protein QMK19_16070 [Streptomyces sp. H10-C2]|uniref:hypothetical protein n=1 Tax=unclassified Streptomyces TaxID=2593676 RepID=UPI0024BB3203|nr:MULTISPECIES: hypothetical protein [unclassified Streptomyces]MDJ0346211.1 hypothetical protein [Streptomyces sp. PH10-H1]MDJ0371162.1 hypothetical protein [Streptomyces sp. H10-C2]
MLRVIDGRTNRLVELPAVRGRLLRMCVHLPCPDGAVGGTEVRALLVGDVLLRAAETGGVQVGYALAVPELPPEQTRTLNRVVAALGIHPPSEDLGGDGGTATVHVFADGHRDAERGVWIEVGRVQQTTATLPGLDLDGADGADPLALRLVLLGHDYREPVTLTAHALTEAGRTLTHWRDCVAGWARMPSKPIPADVRRRARAAIDVDLGTPGVMNVLRHVEAAQDIPDGAKFETFAYLDRILGLELSREVGRS